MPRHLHLFPPARSQPARVCPVSCDRHFCGPYLPLPDPRLRAVPIRESLALELDSSRRVPLDGAALRLAPVPHGGGDWMSMNACVIGLGKLGAPPGGVPGSQRTERDRRGWTHLHPKPEIILFGNDAGTADITGELDIRHVPEVRRNQPRPAPALVLPGAA